MHMHKKLSNDGRDCFIWHSSQHAYYNYMSFGSFVKLSTSSLSDLLYSILGNRELLIPIGLLSACVLVDFMKETFLEMFGNVKDFGLSHCLIGVG
ncbi:hypothetical protein RJ641_031520 [Dillenia turbinata]|uniref:Uncharacterized protein n=1 Tax=Dillenia turbinata TaxID=194707 RepID=A0AAN8ZHJ2_9MAGN